MTTICTTLADAEELDLTRHVGPATELDDERNRFAILQRGLDPMFRRVFPNPLAERTVIILPSMSLDSEELTKLVGASHYEERLLCLLMLLRLPKTHLIYVTSQPIAPEVIDYYLHLLPGVPSSHARRRLTLIACHDGSAAPLTKKLLDRPRLLKRIRAAVADPATAHITCFNATALERTFAVRLGIPLYACDPELSHFGTKSGSRTIFRQAGVPMPEGREHLRDRHDIEAALVELKRLHPTARRAVIKLEEGFSGEGNAIFSYDGAPSGTSLARWVANELPHRARCCALAEHWSPFSDKFERMGGIVELFVDGGAGGIVRSPSVQCRIDPSGQVQILSTHDQVLGGPDRQVFLGCTFPADRSCSAGLHAHARGVAEALRDEGVIGRFGVDFVSVRRQGVWDHQAIEINLRKGGTTHPYLMLQFLTDGQYDTATGIYRTPTGQRCFYVASDNIEDPAYRGLTPGDLIDIAVDNRLHFDSATAQGVVFHLIGALSEYGKLGALCIAPTRAGARRFYNETQAVLDREVGKVRNTRVAAIAS